MTRKRFRPLKKMTDIYPVSICGHFTDNRCLLRHRDLKMHPLSVNTRCEKKKYIAVGRCGWEQNDVYS